jgi:hypothetical protein
MKIEISRKMLDRNIAYGSVKLAGTIENGGISKPDREGMLMPQISSNTNRNMRCFIASSFF